MTPEQRRELRELAERVNRLDWEAFEVPDWIWAARPIVKVVRLGLPELLDENDALRAELSEAKQLAADRDNEIEALHARLGEPYQSGRVSQLRADLIGIRRTNELLTRENIRLAGRIKQLEGGDLVGKLMTDVAVRDARIAELELVRDVAAGILGADDDNRVSEIRVHFSDRPSMYLRNALAMALDDAERP